MATAQEELKQAPGVSVISAEDIRKAPPAGAVAVRKWRRRIGVRRGPTWRTDRGDARSELGRRNTATAAGAVAGAVAGNAIQNRTGAGGSYNVYVRMNNGRETVVTQSDIGGIRQGSYVRVYNGRVWAR